MPKRKSNQYYESFKAWGTAIFHPWWRSIEMIATILPLLSFLSVFCYYLASQQPVPIWNGVALAVFIILFIILSFLAFHRMRVERDTVATIDVTELESRKEYRKPHIEKISQIPEALSEIKNLVDEIFESKRKDRPSPEILSNVIIELLDVQQDDKLLKPERFNSEKKIQKSMKHLRTKMNLNKPTQETEAMWRSKIPMVMDNNDIGLKLKGDDKYNELITQLDKVRIPITQTRVDRNIDLFIDNLPAFYSMKLFLVYGDYKKQLDRFPRDLRKKLLNIEDDFERGMRSGFGQVKNALEEYSIGKV